MMQAQPITKRIREVFERSGKFKRRARVPTVLQMEAVECGAAALAMIMAHFGRYVPLEELRVECAVSRDGSKASNIVRAARRYGMEARGFRKEPEQLRNTSMPAIVHWNFNHFVVLEGFRGNRAYLNDPGRGPTQVTWEEFDEAFTGVVLTFQPGPDFERGGKQRGLVASLVPRLRNSRMGLIYVVMAGLALVVPGMLVPTFQGVFVDDVLVRGFVTWLRPLLILLVVTALLQVTLTWARQYYLLRLETKLALTMAGSFFWHVLRLPLRFYNQRYAGEVGSRVAINDRVATLLSGELATTLLNVVVIVFYGLVMLQYDVVLTLVSVAVVLLNLAGLKYVARRRIDLNQRLLQDQGKVMGVAMGGLQTIETLKATGSESDFFGRWAGQQVKLVNTRQELALTTHLLSAVPPFLMSLNTAAILGVGGVRVMDGHLSMGMLIAFQALMLAFVVPINAMVNLGSKLQEAQGDLNRIDDVLRAEPDSDASVVDAGNGPGGSSIDVKLSGRIELRNVSFGYSPLEPPLIKDFDLVLEPGSRVALVGGSGSGKSTVAKLVAGLYQPWGGEILFDGVRRDQLSRTLVNNSLAFVDQDIFLFENSVRENLTLWDSTVPERDVLDAARDAAVHDEIVERAGGFSSAIEEGGRNFSGGQRQRLEIARALTGNPTILVLDEATSALDPANEMAIDDNLRRRGCTCLLVAHRLSTIRDCDEIIVLDNGNIVERGTHADMFQNNGPYAQLIASA